MFDAGSDTVGEGVDSTAGAGSTIGSETVLVELLVEIGGGGNWF